MKTLLNNHNSEENAYVIEDYPYGRTLRCKMRVWIETTKKGQRVVRQTTNPKKDFEYWNKPKKSTYSDFFVMYIDQETGYVETESYSLGYNDYSDFKAFLAEYESILDSEYHALTIKQGHFLYITRRYMEKLAEGSIYDVNSGAKRAEIKAQARASAIKEVNAMYGEV